MLVTRLLLGIITRDILTVESPTMVGNSKKELV